MNKTFKNFMIFSLETALICGVTFSAMADACPTPDVLVQNGIFTAPVGWTLYNPSDYTLNVGSPSNMKLSDVSLSSAFYINGPDHIEYAITCSYYLNSNKISLIHRWKPGGITTGGSSALTCNKGTDGSSQCDFTMTAK